MMHADGTLFSFREWRALGRFFLFEPGGMAAIVPLYLAYYRPGFHPNDIDASGIIDAWKREYAASPLYRNAA
jgi:predicted metal-dependent hydrolase